MNKEKPTTTLSLIALASISGIIAAFLFQVITARALGPSDFSLFASFIAIVNIGAIGSGALQNSVTVQTALELRGQKPELSLKRKLDPSLVEALSLGILGMLIVLVFSKQIAEMLDAPEMAIFLASSTFPMTFILARHLGIIQGHGKAQTTVWWSTGTGILRLMFAVVSYILLIPVAGYVASVIISILIATVGVSVYLRKIPTRPQHVAFDKATISVLLSTVFFAWMTNIDVIFVRSLVDHTEAGIYAVSATIVKTGFIIPGTLSLYFLPKLVGRFRQSSASITLRIPMIITASGILILTVVLFFVGPYLVQFFFGSEYAVSGVFLLLLCLSNAPWIFVQALMIQTNADTSIKAMSVLFIALTAQWPMMFLLLPNIIYMLVANGIIGLLIAVFLGLFIRNSKHTNQKMGR